MLMKEDNERIVMGLNFICINIIEILDGYICMY